MDPVCFWLRFSYDVTGSHKHNSLFSIFSTVMWRTTTSRSSRQKNAHNFGRWVHVGCTMTYWWLTTAPITDREMKRIEIIHFVLTRWHVGQPHLRDVRTRVFQQLGGMILEEQLAGLTVRHTLWTVGAQKTPACYWYWGGSGDGKDAGSKDVLGVSFKRMWCSGCSVSLSRLDQPSMIWFLSRFQTCDLAPSFHHFSR